MKAPAKPKPIKSSLSKSKDKGKKKPATTIETLNAPAPAQDSTPNEADDIEDNSGAEDTGGLPNLTPELLGFSKIKIGDYKGLYHYIQEHCQCMFLEQMMCFW